MWNKTLQRGQQQRVNWSAERLICSVQLDSLLNLIDSERLKIYWRTFHWQCERLINKTWSLRRYECRFSIEPMPAGFESSPRKVGCPADCPPKLSNKAGEQRIKERYVKGRGCNQSNGFPLYCVSSSSTSSAKTPSFASIYAIYGYYIEHGSSSSTHIVHSTRLCIITLSKQYRDWGILLSLLATGTQLKSVKNKKKKKKNENKSLSGTHIFKNFQDSSIIRKSYKNSPFLWQFWTHASLLSC